MFFVSCKESNQMESEIEITIDKDLMDKINLCFQLGFASVDESGMFQPYALFESQNGIATQLYASGNIDTTLILARDDIKTRCLSSYAIGYVGALEEDNIQTKAIFVEAGSKNSPNKAYIFAHKFKPTDKAGAVLKIGDMVFMEICDSIFK